MVILDKSPEVGAVQLAKKASLAVVDRGYLKIQKQWRNDAANQMDCPLIQVESDVIVPVEEASPKEEYAAATIRSKIHKKLSHFLIPLKQSDPTVDSSSMDFDFFDIDDVGKAISKLHIDQSVQKGKLFSGRNERSSKTS